MTSALRAAVYTRISDDRTGEAAGVTRQRADTEALCKARGWEIVGTFEDNDISASEYARKARPGYQEMIKLVGAGEVDVIASYHTDRLYRRPRELEDLIDFIEGQGGRVTVATCLGDFDLTNSDGRAFARLLVTMAAKSSDDTSRRIRRQRQELAMAGKPSPTTRAFGYEPDGITVRESEALLLKDAAERVLAGDSMNGIAKQWNADGITTPRGKGWTIQTVKIVLLNPRNAGLSVHRGEVVGAGKWPAIIDRETHERLVRMLKDPARRQAPKRRSLLTGLVRCGRCKHQMKRASCQGRAILRCHKEAGRPNCGRMTIGAKNAEEFIIEAVFQALESPELAAKLAGRKQDPVDVKAIEKLEVRLAELAEMWGAGEISRSEWMTARKTIETELEGLRRRATVSRSSAVLAPYLGKQAVLRERWPEQTVDQQRAIIAAVIDRIEVNPPRMLGPRFDHERLDISWVA